MLKRDLPNDYTQKYFQSVSKQRFYDEIINNKQNESFYLTSTQLNKLNKSSQSISTYIRSSLLSSVVLFLFFNKIPVIANAFPNKVIKWTARFGSLILPTYFLSKSQTQILKNLKNNIYSEQQKPYKQFLLSGQYKRLNNEILLVGG